MKNPLAQFFCSAILFFTFLNATGQSTGINYSFSQPSGTISFNNSTAGSITLIAGGTDDQLVSFAAPATWGGFYFGGAWFPQNSTTFFVSSNGWMSFSNQGSSLQANGLSATPLTIAPLWDDLKVHANGEVTYKITGGATSRALVIEWRGMYWDHNASDTAISFQAILYDNAQAIVANRNVIEFRYKNNGNGAINVNNTSGGASIGISGFCGGDVFAFTSAAGAPSKTTPEASNISLKPDDSVHHRFTPVIHPNDECATAETIAFNPALPLISSLGTTLHSTQSPAALPPCGILITVSDVWYTFSKPANIANFEIFIDSLDCRGTSYNTGIEIYSSCGGAPITCDFGSTGPAGTNAASYINLTNEPCNPQQYWVRVYSADTSYRGYFRFNIRSPGRNCAYANNITPCGIPYSSPGGLSTCGFGFEFDSSIAEPHTPFMYGEDYIFTYTPPATVCVDFALSNTPANSNPGLFIYRGCPDFGTCIGFVTGTGGSTLNFNNVSLVAGLTYYFVVDYDSVGGTTCMNNFDFAAALSTAASAANDICSAANNISVVTSTTCTGAIDYNNNCTAPTAAGTIPLPGCGNFTDGVTPDVWFTFTSSSTSVHRVKIDAGSSPAAPDLAMAVYTGTCGAMTLVNCDNSSNGWMPLVVIIPPAAGTLYYVRVWSNNGTQTGNFKICISDGCTAANDLCPGAIPLTIGQYEPGDNSCATGINEPFAGTNATCWNNNLGQTQLNTVWYSFVATDDTMKIRTHLITLFDSQVALYSSTGGCGGTFTQLYCNDNSPAICGTGVNRNSQIIATGLNIGTTYFIRVDGVNANTGTFEIIVLPGSTPFPAIYSQDCPLAVGLCDNSTISVSNPGYQGAGNICDVSAGATCLSIGETQSVFYTFSVTGTGGGTPVEFTITPGSSGNYDFMLWCIDTVFNGGDQLPAVPNYCSNLVNQSMFPAVICNFSYQGTTGCSASEGLCQMTCYQSYAYPDPGMMPAIVVPNGMTATFLLLVNSDYYNNGFMLDWMGTPLNGNPSYLTWQGGNNSNWSDSSNWNAGACGEVPDCINQIGAIITSSAVMPVISSNTSVSDITINAGATLTISPGVRLDVCGNFINNGMINCGQGSTVRFIGSRNTYVAGTFNLGFNNFYHLEVAKDSGATLSLNTDIFIAGNDSVYSGMVNASTRNIYLGGNFYNYNGNTSFINSFPGNLTFVSLSGLVQHFRNDGSPLTLANVVMNQIITGGSLTLDTNATSDLKLGFNGTLTLTNGKIITGATREVNITNAGPAACSVGNAMSYVEGNLRRAIGMFAGTYEFPVGYFTKGYQRFAIQYGTPPFAPYNILGKFSPWVGMPAGGPVVQECGNNGWDIMPPFDNGYWTMDADSTTGLGVYKAHAYPANATNNVGATFSIMKSVSNNGLGPWLMEGSPYCPSTASHSERDGLSTFSDFAVVQSDIGNYILSPVHGNFRFNLFPNPASEKIILTFNADDSREYLVHLNDVTGRTILSEKINTIKGINSKEINLHGISIGIYLVVLENNNVKEARKLILQ